MGLGILLGYDIGRIFYNFLACFQIKRVYYSNMQTKATELAGILEGETIFYVKTETSNDRESIDEITLEKQQDITCRVERSRIAFTAGETTAAFGLLETAEILTNRTEEAEVIVTLAQNGGLQIKVRG
jgi:hypothetical protein